MTTKRTVAERVEALVPHAEDCLLHANIVALVEAEVEAVQRNYEAAQHLADATSKDWQLCKQQLAAAEGRVRELERELDDARNQFTENSLRAHVIVLTTPAKETHDKHGQQCDEMEGT